MSSLVFLSLLGFAASSSCSSASCQTTADDISTSLVQTRTILKHGGQQKVLTELEAQAQQQSLSLAKLFADAEWAMPEASETKQLFESFKICGQCKSFARWGEPHDGGYLMCMDGLKQGSVSAVYSLGVEHHDQWSEDVAKSLGLTVHQFDCTVGGSACKVCQFHKKCIVSSDGQHPVPGHESEGWSLMQAIAETGQANAADNSLLMKMDIEGSEWAVYAAEPPEALKKFGQLIMEFHQLGDTSRHAEYLQAMTHLLSAGFKVAHLHGNNFEGMVQDGATLIPNVLEVTFIHGKARPDGCLADQDYNTLDAPNRPGVAELPKAHIALVGETASEWKVNGQLLQQGTETTADTYADAESTQEVLMGHLDQDVLEDLPLLAHEELARQHR